MKKYLLFNLSFMQSNGWSAYHGGGENDFTVFMYLLNEIGNHDEWTIYGYHTENKPFIREMNSVLTTYKNIELISAKELHSIKEQMRFHAIYASGIHGIEWIVRENLKAMCGMVVIHGIRRYELRPHVLELFFPVRWFERIHLWSGFFVPWLIKKSIEYQHRNLLKNMPSAIQLIATSEDTKSKLLAMCPHIHQNQVGMLYTSPKLSISLTKEMESLTLKKYNLCSKQYILLISLSRPEKNVYFALKNLLRLVKEHGLPLTIFACGEAKGNYFIKKLKKQANAQLIIERYVSTEELTVLYKHAFLFVYPSRTEGFGMPILEAMEHGTPVCCSALSPLIEVGGNAAEYFSLENELEFRAKVLKFYRDSVFYDNKRRLSLARYGEITTIQQRDLEKKKEMILNATVFTF